MKTTFVLCALFFALPFGCGKQDEPSSTAPSRATATPVTAIDFSGNFSSTWGPSTFTQTGTKVTCKYPNGSMTCDVVGDALKCTWRESSTFGLATLHKLPDGKITGTWGNNGSDKDGGQWTFVPKR